MKMEAARSSEIWDILPHHYRASRAEDHDLNAYVTFSTSNGYRGALSLGVKRPEREVDHSPPSSAEVKNEWTYTSAPPILHGVVLS
jgi:hypothetical protein